MVTKTDRPALREETRPQMLRIEALEDRLAPSGDGCGCGCTILVINAGAHASACGLNAGLSASAKV